MARRGVPCLRRADGLAGLTCRACHGVDVHGKGRGGGGYEQAGHHWREEMFMVFSQSVGFQEGRSGSLGAPAELDMIDKRFSNRRSSRAS